MLANFESFFAELTAIRKSIHENAELSFQEYKTQALVKDYLINQAKIPEEQITVSGKTGLVADIYGPTDGDKTTPLTCLAFRGDMDALPMTERNPHLPYESKNAGAAHMCGHDGHTTNLMGFATLVSQRRHLLPPHTFVRLLFQPAEEGHFGAPAMIKDGCLENVDEVYGYHNAPFPVGVIGVKSGALLAHSSRFKIVVSGPGGHGSAPHQTQDPIVAAGQLIVAMQTIVSRNLSPHDSAIVSITQVHGGEADNVIPSNVTLSGTLRDFCPHVAETVQSRMRGIVENTCQAYNVKGEIIFEDGYPVLMNPEKETTIFQALAERVVGKSRVTSKGLPVCGSEDFSYFLQERPGCFFVIGTVNPNETQNRNMHSDTYDFNDAILPLGVRIFLEIVHDRYGVALYTPDELESILACMEYSK